MIPFLTPSGRVVVLLVVSTPISLLATFSLWMLTVCNRQKKRTVHSTRYNWVIHVNFVFYFSIYFLHLIYISSTILLHLCLIFLLGIIKLLLVAKFNYKAMVDSASWNLQWQTLNGKNTYQYCTVQLYIIRTEINLSGLFAIQRN